MTVMSNYYDSDQPQSPEITYIGGDNAAYQGPTPTDTEDFQKALKSDKPN